MDEKRKKEILMDIIPTDVENAEKILDGINEKDEQKCLAEFYKRIIDGSKYCRGFRCVADSIIKQLGDEAWGREIYEVAVSKSNDTGGILEVASSYLRYLDDEKRAKELCAKAVEVAKSSNDYIRIANFELDYFKDVPHLSDYYNKAEELSKNDPYEYYKVGISILSNTSDAERGIQIINKSLESIWEVGVLSEIYDEIDLLCACNSDSKVDGDLLRIELLEKIHEKIMDEASGIDDYVEIAESAPDLKDKALEEAEFAASEVDDYLRLQEYYREEGESEKAQEMYQKAIDEADTDDPDVMARIKEAMK